MDIYNKILNIVSPVLESRKLLLIELIVRGDERKRVIELFIDSSENVSAEILADLSRAINSLLSQEDSFLSNYRLDISSPGVDRPLKFIEQYHKHLNRSFDVNYQDGDEVKKIRAKLKSVSGGDLVFNDGKKEFIINFNQIIKAKVLISFS